MVLCEIKTSSSSDYGILSHRTMISTYRKTKILVFIPNYLPGYKSGGILRSVVNTVDWLNNDFEFWIVGVENSDPFVTRRRV